METCIVVSSDVNENNANHKNRLVSNSVPTLYTINLIKSLGAALSVVFALTVAQSGSNSSSYSIKLFVSYEELAQSI